MTSEAALIGKEGQGNGSTASFSWEEIQILLSALEARVICRLGEVWHMHCCA